jgi:hypothetical protein
MTANVVKEVDAVAMAEFLEDSEIKIKEEKTEKEKFMGFADFAKPRENHLDAPKKEICKASAKDLNGFPPLFKSPEKKKSDGLAGIKSAVAENPILSLLAGAILVGGAIMLYKHLSKKTEKNEDSTEEDTKREKLKRKRKLELRLHSAKSKMVDETVGEAQGEISEMNQKEEVITGKSLGMAVAATVAGSIAGAALGDLSLIAAIPLGILGINKLNTNLTMAAAGMALAIGYKSEKSEGNFIERAFDRVKQFFTNLFDKIFFFRKEEEKTPEGYYNGILGLVPLRSNRIAGT